MRQGLIFDGDDTLWETEPLYDKARAAARQAVMDGGLDGDLWERRERSRDVENFDRFGLSARRPTSCREAYELVCAELGQEPSQATAAEIYDRAAAVFTSTAPVYQWVNDVLAELQADWTLVLLTAGDTQVQARRISDSRLRSFFDEVRIVDGKTEATFQAIVRELDLDASKSWSIGNNPRTDILPALECGLQVVWVPTHVWELERDHEVPGDTQLHVLRDLSELPDLLAVQTQR